MQPGWNLDTVILNHEVGHGVMAVVEDTWLLRIVASRHELLDGHGLTEYVFKPDDPRDFDERLQVNARIALAGCYGEPWTTEAQNAGDVTDVKSLWTCAGNKVGWVSARDVEVREVFQRPKVRAALRALGAAIVEREGWTIGGPDAERIVQEALR